MMRRGIKMEENRDEARKNWKDDGRRIVEFFCLGRGGRWRGEGFENAISYQDLSLGGAGTEFIWFNLRARIAGRRELFLPQVAAVLIIAA